MWQPPSLSLIWPPFFRSDMTEEQQLVSTTALALQSNMITRRMALEKLRAVYPFENIEAVLEQLDEQVEEMSEHSVENMLAKALKGKKGEEELDAADEAESEGAGGDEEETSGG